jgi:hypothetical protein
VLLVLLLKVDFVGRLLGFVLGLRVGLVDLVRFVVVAGISLGTVYSSHFGPMTSLMPFQRSSLFAEEVDLMDLMDKDADDGFDFVFAVGVVDVFSLFQISNLPLVELEIAFDFEDTVVLALFAPFQNPNPPI